MDILYDLVCMALVDHSLSLTKTGGVTFCPSSDSKVGNFLWGRVEVSGSKEKKNTVILKKIKLGHRVI